ncbi:MAG: phenylacetate--CoA ligase family protein [Rhodocyclaceae bacterium]|nr:phenylacetate--CoA ligase family protein [Rhodocyclaceae bacterium]
MRPRRLRSAAVGAEPAVWPRLPGPAGAHLLALLRQFEQSQWIAPDTLEQRQWRQLPFLLAQAATLRPYRRRFAAAGFNPAAPDPQAFRRIQPLRRADIQAAGGGLFCTPPAMHGETSLRFTSGSTGTPIQFASTDLERRFWSAFTLREHAWHRRDLSGVHAFLRPGEARQWPTWGPPADLVCATGRAARFSTSEPVEVQAEWLAGLDPDYLLTMPSNLAELVREFDRRGIRLPRLREVRTVGEVVSDDLRRWVREAWGVRIADIYSASEAGYLALECPQAEGRYHVQAEGVLLEVLRADGRPCAPGEIGEVVVTPLHNFAMPLVRYAIGDFAEVGGPCPCGRGLPVLARILGRVRNMLTLPDGGRRWPLFGLNDLPGIPLRQYRIVQRSATRLEAQLVVDRPLRPDEEDRIRAALRGRLHPDFQVDLVYPAFLPRDPSGKFEDFINACPPAEGTPGMP